MRVPVPHALSALNSAWRSSRRLHFRAGSTRTACLIGRPARASRPIKARRQTPASRSRPRSPKAIRSRSIPPHCLPAADPPLAPCWRSATFVGSKPQSLRSGNSASSKATLGDQQKTTARRRAAGQRELSPARRRAISPPSPASIRGCRAERRRAIRSSSQTGAKHNRISICLNNGVAQLNSPIKPSRGRSVNGNYLAQTKCARPIRCKVASKADRDALRQIETQTTASLAQVDQLLNSLSDDITRQSGYVAGERNNLVTLALAIQNGQLYGPSLRQPAIRHRSAPPRPPPAAHSRMRPPRGPQLPRRVAAAPARRPRPTARRWSSSASTKPMSIMSSRSTQPSAAPSSASRARPSPSRRWRLMPAAPRKSRSTPTPRGKTPRTSCARSPIWDYRPIASRSPPR